MDRILRVVSGQDRLPTGPTRLAAGSTIACSRRCCSVWSHKSRGRRRTTVKRAASRRPRGNRNSAVRCPPLKRLPPTEEPAEMPPAETAPRAAWPSTHAFAEGRGPAAGDFAPGRRAAEDFGPGGRSTEDRGTAPGTIRTIGAGRPAGRRADPSRIRVGGPRGLLRRPVGVHRRAQAGCGGP